MRSANNLRNHFATISHTARSAVATMLPRHKRAIKPQIIVWQRGCGAPKWGELAAPPMKRLRQMEAHRIVLPLNFHQPCAGGASSSPPLYKTPKNTCLLATRSMVDSLCGSVAATAQCAVCEKIVKFFESAGNTGSTGSTGFRGSTGGSSPSRSQPFSAFPVFPVLPAYPRKNSSPSTPSKSQPLHSYC